MWKCFLRTVTATTIAADPFSYPDEFYDNIGKIYDCIRQNQITRETQWILPHTIDMEYFIQTINDLLQSDDYIWRIVRISSMGETYSTSDTMYLPPLKFETFFKSWIKTLKKLLVKMLATSRSSIDKSRIVKPQLFHYRKRYVQVNTE